MIRSAALGRTKKGWRVIDGYECPPGLKPRRDVWNRIVLRSDGTTCAFEADPAYEDEEREKQPFSLDQADEIVDQVTDAVRKRLEG